MVSKAKNKNNNVVGDNILYLQDSDAKALGIIEGSSQRVYIDDREVEVVFVDEHEVLPVSSEDKKIYQDAYKIAERYIEASANDNFNGTWGALASDNNEARIITSHYSGEHRPSTGSVLKDSWNNFKSLFKRNTPDAYSRQRFDYIDRTSSNPAGNDRSMVRYQTSNSRVANDDNSKKHNHSMRNDVFTKEELEIIQNVIDKTRRYESGSRNDYDNGYAHMSQHDSLNKSNQNNIKSKSKK